MARARRPIVAPAEVAPVERLVFGRNFRRARKALGVTQIGVRKVTGYSQAFISDVERGKVSISLDYAVVLARLVDQPLWQLFKPD